MPGRRHSIVRAIGICGGLAILPVVASAANNYDGTYKGQYTLTRGDQSICGRSSMPITKDVVNGQFSLVYDPTHHVGVTLTVQPDGTFSGSQQYMYMSRQEQVRASGRISGNVLTAHIEGSGCSRDYNLTKK